MAVATATSRVTNPDGSVTTQWSDGTSSTRVTNPNGSITTKWNDGTSSTSTIAADGQLAQRVPDGATTKQVTDPTTGKPITIVVRADGTPETTDPVTNAWSGAVDAASPTNGVRGTSIGPVSLPTRIIDSRTGQPVNIGSWRNTLADLKDVADRTNVVGDPGGIGKLTGTDTTGNAIRNNAVKILGANVDLSGVLDSAGKATGVAGSGTVPGGGGGGAPTANTGAIDASISSAQGLRDQFANAYQNFRPTAAPVVQGAQLAPQTYATAGQVGYVPQVQAPNVGTAQQVQAATVGAYLNAAGAAAQAGTATAQQIGALERVRAGEVGQYQGATAQRVGDIERVQGVNVQGAPQVTNGGPVIAERANATTLDQQQQAEFRQNQKTLLGYLNGAIDGTAPSVAKLQLDEATQRNEANQLGLASAASRGGNSALAMRTAANNIGMINQKAAADAALLRAQEIATARGQYGEVANSGRTTDVSIAGQNAGLLTGVSQSNAQLGTTANITGATLNQKTSSENAGNAVAVNSLRAQLAQAAQTTNANNNLSASTTNATLGTQVATSNAKNQLDAQSLQAQLNQQASTANAGNSLAAQTTNATLGTQASVTNANNQTSASIATANNATQASVANANNSLAAQIAQAKLTQDASTSNAANATSLQQLQAQLIYNASHDNAGNALSAAQTNANLQTQASTTNATNATSLNVNQGQLTNAANLANAANQVTTAGQNITSQQNAAANSLTASGQTIQGQANVLDNQTKLQAAQMDADAKSRAAALGGLGAAGAAWLASDRRLKTDVSDGKGSAQDLLNHLSAKSFRYKDGGDRQTGVMAQDVEKSPAGKTFVRETSRGKALDPVAGFGSVLAMLSTLNDRMKKVEGARAP